MVTTPRKQLQDIVKDIKRKTPDALHNMLSKKETPEDAKMKYKARQEMETIICPPTCSGILKTMQNLTQILGCIM